MSFYLSPTLSQAGIVSERLNVVSLKQRHTIARDSNFLVLLLKLFENLNGVTSKLSGAKYRCDRLKSVIFDPISHNISETFQDKFIFTMED